MVVRTCVVCMGDFSATAFIFQGGGFLVFVEGEGCEVLLRDRRGGGRGKRGKIEGKEDGRV